MADLRERIQSAPTRSLAGTFHRMVHEKWKADILDATGSFIYGGRYNPKDSFGALYLAESEELSLAERLKQAGGDLTLLGPQVVGAVSVKLKKVLDLTDAGVRRRLGVSKNDLADLDDRSLTQAIGILAREAGCDGLLVPSAVSAGANLVVFDPDERLIKLKSLSPFSP